MNVQIVSLPSLPLVMIRHRGPYDGLSGEFDRLGSWAAANAVPVVRTLGLYWDNPDFVAASRLRSAACVEVPVGFALTNRGALPLEPGTLKGGQYATTRYVGPYDAMEPVWSRFTNHVETILNRQITDDPAFEVYVNDAATTPPQDLVTELYLPVR